GSGSLTWTHLLQPRRTLFTQSTRRRRSRLRRQRRRLSSRGRLSAGKVKRARRVTQRRSPTKKTPDCAGASARCFDELKCFDNSIKFASDFAGSQSLPGQG